LIRQEGEVDIILASNVTEPCSFPYYFEGVQIHVETPAEILAKKIQNRGSSFTVRDVFDVAVALYHDPHVVDSLRPFISQEDFQKTLNRVTLLKRNFPDVPCISQFINIIQTEYRPPDIYDEVIKAFETIIVEST